MNLIINSKHKVNINLLHKNKYKINYNYIKYNIDFFITRYENIINYLNMYSCCLYERTFANSYAAWI